MQAGDGQARCAFSSGGAGSCSPPGSSCCSPRCPSPPQQTEHLTSGGFEVPGSQSQVVSENITRFEGAQRDHSPSCWRAARARTPRPCAPRSTASRGSPTAAATPSSRPQAAAAAKRDAATASITVVPLAVEGDRDQTADLAVDFRDELGTAGARRRGAAPGRPAGALGRHAGPHEGGPRERGADRLPGRAPDPARRLRLAGRRRAAARARLRQRGDHRARRSTSSRRPLRCRCS